MEIGATPFSPSSNRPAASRRDQSTSQASADQAANDRLTQLTAQVQAAETEGSAELARVQQDYEQQSVVQSGRDESALQNQQNKGYENVRQAQRAQAAELARLKKSGDAELARVREYYRNEIHRADSDGSRELRELERQDKMAIDHEVHTGTLAIDGIKADETQKYGMLKTMTDERLGQIASQNQKQVDQLSESARAATLRAQEQLDERFQSLVRERGDVLANLEGEARAKLGEIRMDTSQKLSAYRERQADPFYKLTDLKARLSEEPDAFVLRARVPSYEEPHLTVSAHEDRIMLSGYRRNEEKHEPSPGHRQSTSSYQSYTESFPLSWPVEAKSLSRSYDGEWLTVIVPKKGRSFSPGETAKSPSAEPRRAVLEKPLFPENLPHVNPEPESIGSSERTPGSGTLI